MRSRLGIGVLGAKLVSAAIFAALLVCAPREKALSTTCSLPAAYFTGETLTAANLNAPLTTLLSCIGNIDFANVGANGFYASQIIPTNGAQATFGGVQTYTFPAAITLPVGATIGNNFVGNNIIDLGTSGQPLYLQLQSGTGTVAQINTGACANSGYLCLAGTMANDFTIDTSGNVVVRGNITGGNNLVVTGTVTSTGVSTGAVSGTTFTGTGGTFPLVYTAGVQKTAKPIITSSNISVPATSTATSSFGVTYSSPPICTVTFVAASGSLLAPLLNTVSTTAITIYNGNGAPFPAEYICAGQ
jgi:hypothetical protein